MDYPEGTIRRGKTCKDYYKEMYPKLSDRTMQRDFQVLSRVGFPIRYNRSLRYYEFFEEDLEPGRVYLPVLRTWGRWAWTTMTVKKRFS